MNKTFAIVGNVCQHCGREYHDINNCACPSDDCPSNEKAAQQQYALDAGNAAPADITVEENSLAGENIPDPRQ